MIGESPRPETELPFKLDWKAGFLEFCREHGEPMDDGRCLVFADGWTCGNKSYQGPVEPPPADPQQLAARLRSFWTLRREEVLRQIEESRRTLAEVRELQEAHGSLPLFVKPEPRWDQRRRMWRRRRSRPLDLQELTDRLAWLEQEAEECNRQLTEPEPAILKGSSDERDP